MEWSGVEWSGVEWIRVEWIRVEWVGEWFVPAGWQPGRQAYHVWVVMVVVVVAKNVLCATAFTSSNARRFGVRCGVIAGGKVNRKGTTRALVYSGGAAADPVTPNDNNDDDADEGPGAMPRAKSKLDADGNEVRGMQDGVFASSHPNQSRRERVRTHARTRTHIDIHIHIHIHI